ncbi:hypothetical protein JTE90_017411 [Oedothorax gibbosus]|uniref:Uncharacterized protein n=1 Tax=Oedothorax gibbosus TaxID=931172 RepID=A0AAV6U6U7_9ARAC|nr:hypothetical protein JTE90_017411 [Oedothorax gibbosus]
MSPFSPQLPPHIVLSSVSRVRGSLVAAAAGERQRTPDPRRARCGFAPEQLIRPSREEVDEIFWKKITQPLFNHECRTTLPRPPRSAQKEKPSK